MTSSPLSLSLSLLAFTTPDALSLALGQLLAHSPRPPRFPLCPVPSPRSGSLLSATLSASSPPLPPRSMAACTRLRRR
ncbi:hypothetical protein GY45DRAFT_1332256 [Cubamyces sp. BRFM 1775]|nr:hypothetical protein GY45DRAFT_1332256 [Cubamyces sp. BRFM 1775]